MDKKEDMIAKIKEAGLTGRGGAGFPTGVKWEMVKSQKADKKYIICNGSEGEPGVFKDKYLLEKYPEVVVEGIKIALETVDHSLAYIYLNKEYYKQFSKKLEKLCDGLPIVIFEKKWGYLGGEETAVCEVIEGKRPIVRKKPPFPGESGLWGFPTLVNNVETFYHVGRIKEGNFKNTKFFCVSGDVKKECVWEFPAEYTIRQVLEETGNFPEFDFFVQAGGGASGEILLPSELDQEICGASSIIIFNKEKTDPYELMRKWAEFFLEENCDKCVPCREGVYRISEMVKTEKLDREFLNELFFVLENTSFCSLGRGVAVPFRSLINKVL
ncbi:MAG: NADH-ubiquinone oxidoreductase-F iron-sulfur binding region domain-containing protein [Candidatus Pacebacteria bacterium]|nr:NADH-ubiquinone oxidoreductase-F iron-sulfur binding region domain-containing protein [Candidatus Paceibacterota bacterium]